MLSQLIEDLLISEITQTLQSEFPDQPIERMIRDKIQDDPPTFQKLRNTEPKQCKITSNERCCARIWDNHRGGRCASKKTNKHYCSIHQGILDREGELRFGRYDKPKPLYNKRGNVLPWFEGDPFHEIETLFAYQRHSLLTLIKQSQVTPQ